MVKPNPKTKALKEQVRDVLRDQAWHCRGHEYEGIQTGQLAGGGGIQGLQRGTKKTPGIVIESKNELCPKCKESTRWDRWTGETKAANSPAGISKKLTNRILGHFDYVDVIEQRKRAAHELVIDHRFPMERWGQAEGTLSSDMPEDEIQKKFQLLKKDNSGNHNLLKSRACENCIKTGDRGTPLGINFFYEGDSRWPAEVPKQGEDAEKGCHGCGWYDFLKWRTALNGKLRKS